MNSKARECLEAYQLLMKAEQESTEELLRQMDYWCPKYLATQINTAFHIKMDLISEVLTAIESEIEEFDSTWIPPLVLLTDQAVYSDQLSKSIWDGLNEDQKSAYKEDLMAYLGDPNVMTNILANGLEDQSKLLRDKVYAITTMSMAKHTLTAFNSDKPLGHQWNKYAVDYMAGINEHVENMAIKMKVTDISAVVNALNSGMTKGNGVQSVINNLRNNEEFSVERARTFAITETLTAYSQGQNIGIMDSDVVTHKEWMHTGTKGIKARPHHVDMDGLIIPKEDQFDVGGYPADFPRDPKLPPKERINCHCAINPSLGEDDGWGDMDEYLESARAELEDNGGYTFDEGMTFEDLEEEIFNKSKYAKDNPDAIPAGKRTQPDTFADILSPSIDGINTQALIGAGLPKHITATEFDGDNYLGIETTDKTAPIELFADNSLVPNLDHQESIGYYTNDGFRDINSALRGNISSTPEMNRHIKNLVDAIGEHQLPYNTTVYRGVNFYGNKGLYDNLKVGNTIIDPAFMSTSPLKYIAKGFFDMDDEDDFDDSMHVIFKLMLPEGYKSLPMFRYSEYKEEAELLLKPNSKFIISEVNRTSNMLDVTLIPAD